METPLRAFFETLADYVASAAELASILLIALGVVEAVAHLVSALMARQMTLRAIKDVWLRLAGWILLSLEFALGADIVRTSVSPTWEDVGKLAAIAAIRTVLSVFLERDLSSFERERPGASTRAE